MNILEKLEWLNDTVRELDSEDARVAGSAKAALGFYVEEIAKALLSVAYSQDDVVHEVQSKLILRSRRGMETYGVSMEDNTTLTSSQWIDHAVEEALDLANYLTKLKRTLDDKNT